MLVTNGRIGFTLQLPVQAQSTLFVADWEKVAGPDEIIAVAEAADRGGFFAVAACEHVAVPPHRAVTMGTFWADPISTLSLVAARTSRVRLMTYVYLLALRHPLMAAKALSTLDFVSKGRLIAGVGAGHVEEEFDALGVDFAHRGTRLSQSIEALKASFAGEHPVLAAPFTAAELGLQPRPVQTPRPPIMVAGSTEPAMRRAAKHADGWLPQSPATKEMIEFVTTERARYAPDDPLTIGHIGGMVYVGTPAHEVAPYAMTGSALSIAERLHASIPAGAHLVQVMFTARSAQEMCDQVAAFGAEVIPAFT
jgi:probable F420-dependent oxidoreductase